MSYVTDVLVLSGIDERGIPELQAWLTDNNWGNLVQIDGRAGGSKAMQADVWAAAYNYFDDDEFFKAFQNIAWEFPDEVMLLVQREEDCGFSRYLPVNIKNQEPTSDNQNAMNGGE